MKFFRALAVFLSLAPFGLAALDPAAFKAAVELYTRRQPLEAQHAFEALALENPENPDIQFYLGRLALQRDDQTQAVTYLEKAVSLRPQESRYHVRLGDAYGRSAQKAGLFSKLGLAAKCRTEYARAVELDPKSIEARLSLMGFYQQAPGFAGGSMDQALEQAREIKKLDAFRGRLAIAGLCVAEKKFNEAFAEFDEVLKTSPDDYAALFQSGRLSAVCGQRLDEGLTALQRCLALTPPEGQPPHAAAHWRIGNILEKKGDKAGARAAYEAALKIDPKFPQALESLRKL